MSSWNGNGGNNGPSIPFWKVMLVVLLTIGAAYLWTLIVFPEGGAP